MSDSHTPGARHHWTDRYHAHGGVSLFRPSRNIKVLPIANDNVFINGCVNEARVPMPRCAFPGDRRF
jgi:hypothetical protein